MCEKWVTRMCLEREVAKFEVVTLHFSYAFMSYEGNKVSPKVGLFYIHNLNLPCSYIVNLHSIRKLTVLWDVLLCSLEERCRNFGGTSCLHLQGRRVPEEGKESMFLERWYLSTGLHNVASQNTVMIKFATMRT